MISAVILSKNEAFNISACIKSLTFCDEIIVIDDMSVDNTVKIAKSLGAKVVKRRLNGDFSEQRNYGLVIAKNEWVLQLDADERISEKLASEIQDTIKNKELSGYEFKRRDYIWGKWLRHGEIGAFRSTRLVRKGSGRWIRKVHEVFVSNGILGKLQIPIDHYPHNNIFELIKSIDNWSSLHAQQNLTQGVQSNILKIVFFPIAHFVKNYIFKLGMIDGIHGFVFALTMASHSFLSWSKQWLTQKKLTIK